MTCLDSFDEAVKSAAQALGLDPDVICAIIKAESSDSPQAQTELGIVQGRVMTKEGKV